MGEKSFYKKVKENTINLENHAMIREKINKMMEIMSLNSITKRKIMIEVIFLILHRLKINHPT